MRYVYPSFQEAARTFEAYAAIEPKLQALWDLCRDAAPPTWAADDDDDGVDDGVEAGDAYPPDDGWCAEDFFLQHVKSPLLLLAGMHRPSDLRELQTSKTYETLYDLLLNWALVRSCACCADGPDEIPHDDAAHVGAP